MLNFQEPAATLVFVITIALSLLGLFRAPQVIDICLFRPYYFLRRQQYLTIISSGFVHADLGHLLFNMFTFYFFAFPMERQFGSAYFIALYLFGLAIQKSQNCGFSRSAFTNKRHGVPFLHSPFNLLKGIRAIGELFADLMEFQCQGVHVG
jgi:membrane associated rhomboid family serine protease